MLPESMDAERTSRRRFALISGAGVLLLLMGLGAAALITRQPGEEVPFPAAGYMEDGQVQPSPQPPEKSPAAILPGSGATENVSSDRDRRTDEPLDKAMATEPAHPALKPGPHAGSDLDKVEGTSAAPAPTMDITGPDPQSRNRSPQESSPPKVKIQDVVPSPKKVEEKTQKPWVQIR